MTQKLPTYYSTEWLCVPKPLHYLCEEPLEWEPPKVFLHIARTARVHKSEWNPLIMSSQLQPITAHPGSLRHLQHGVCLAPDAKYHIQQFSQADGPLTDWIWSMCSGNSGEDSGAVKMVKVREEKHAELYFMSLPAPCCCAPLVWLARRFSPNVSPDRGSVAQWESKASWRLDW